MIPSCFWTTGLRPAGTDLPHGTVCSFFMKSLALLAGLFILTISDVSGQDELLNRKISLSRQNSTVYEALNRIAEKAGCSFVYDSRLVENDKRVRLSADQQPLREVLDKVLANPELDYKVIGTHVLIYRPAKNNNRLIPAAPLPKVDTTRQIVLRGYVYDEQNKTAVPYVSIGIEGMTFGTITNNDGYFVLKVPPEYSGSSLTISHLGYMGQSIPIQLLDRQQVDIFLTRRVISIQEVIIRYIDPEVIIRKSIERRNENYNRDPAYITTFYREGVSKNDRILSYSEAVFKVYKSPVDLNEKFDQVKQLKSRKVQNVQSSDTVMLKLKAGILAGLQLDIAKCLPDFLDPEQMELYTYNYTDLVSFDRQDAYAISFTRKEGMGDAMNTGTLYIDKESYAILGAEFQINPDFLEKAAGDLVQKKSRRLVVKFDQIRYTISYINYNGTYYLNHARSDLQIRTRLKNRLLFDHFAAFMEVATCHVDTLNVTRFDRQESLKPDVVFSDTPYVYDVSFWGDYNIIVPEARISDALSRIMRKIEEIE